MNRRDSLAALLLLGADAVVVLPDPVLFTARRQVVELATRYLLPSVYHVREVVEIGGFLS